MISAGQRDRVIYLAPGIPSKEPGSGARVTVPGAWAMYYAMKEENKVSAVHQENQVQPIADLAFIVDYEKDLTMPLFLRFEDDVFEVRSIEEVGYRENMRIRCQRARQMGVA